MIKCGIIGCGVIAPTHIEGYQALPGVSVTHLCDLIGERADKLGEKYHIARRSTDYHELLADPEITLVSVCTDHASHARIVIDALEAGKHVICEKALGRTFDDLEAMTAAARRHPELVSAGIFQHRFEPANRQLKTLVETGKFGKLLTVNLNFNCLRTAEYYQKDAWRGTLRGEGGGILINQAIHHLDQLRYLFGDIKSLCARTANLTHQGVIEVEDSAAFVFEFQSGVFGAVTATNSSAAEWRSFLAISGTDAILEYANEQPVHVEGKEAEAIREALKPEHVNQKVTGKTYYGAGHTAQLADFVDAVREHRPAEETLPDAANSAALVLAVYQSEQTGSWVDVRNYTR